MGDLRERVWQHIARNRDRYPHAAVARMCRGFLRAFDNSANYILEVSGEQRILDILASTEECVLFDVGANVGEWTLTAADALPESSLHSFEPVELTFRALSQNVARLGGRVTVNQCALGGADGVLPLHVPRDRSTHSSVFGSDGTVEEVQVMRGDRYCSEQGIEHIRFLKVDTEGWDHEVLMGFSEMIEQRKIDCIQFEYGAWALESRFLLKDFFIFLERNHMRVGKVYPRSVEFGPYRRELEDFTGLNFLAVDESLTGLIAALDPHGRVS